MPGPRQEIREERREEHREERHEDHGRERSHFVFHPARMTKILLSVGKEAGWITRAPEGAPAEFIIWMLTHEELIRGIERNVHKGKYPLMYTIDIANAETNRQTEGNRPRIPQTGTQQTWHRTLSCCCRRKSRGP